jgi:hypothetical protein
MTNGTQIRHWLPLNKLTSTLINNITVDLESSVMWYHTLKHYDIQPVKIITPSEEVTVGEISVVWASHARIIESLATNPRRGAMIAVSQLNGLLDERRKVDEERAGARKLDKSTSRAQARLRFGGLGLFG